jgi:hypothetical protein
VYGLFKVIPHNNKKLKQGLISLINFINNTHRNRNPKFFRRKKVLFSKKFNVLFFRAGRKILMDYFNIKKHLTQKFITKKLTKTLKKKQIMFQFLDNISATLLQSNLFYSSADAKKFIQTFGIYIDGHLRYDPEHSVLVNTQFSLQTSQYLLKFINSNRAKFTYQLRKIKFYKYRVRVVDSMYKYK